MENEIYELFDGVGYIVKFVSVVKPLQRVNVMQVQMSTSESIDVRRRVEWIRKN